MSSAPVAVTVTGRPASGRRRGPHIPEERERLARGRRVPDETRRSQRLASGRGGTGEIEPGYVALSRERVELGERSSGRGAIAGGASADRHRGHDVAAKHRSRTERERGAQPLER